MDDQALRQAFSSSSLAAAEWTHEAHVRTAFLHWQQYPLDLEPLPEVP